MNTYVYTAHDILTQKKVKGELKGESEAVIYDLLADKNLYPEKIKRKNKKSAYGVFQKGIKLKEIHFFCKQFEALCSADIEVAKALEICKMQTISTAMKLHLEHVAEAVKSGQALSDAVAYEQVFPDLLVQLIKCGELSGDLKKVMKSAVLYFEMQLGVHKKLKKALSYPVLVLTLVAIVLIIFMTHVIPSYMKLLIDTGAAIPLPTQIVFQVSSFLMIYGPSIGGAMGCLILLGYQMKRQKVICQFIERIKLKIPVMGKLIRQDLTVRFTSTMALLLQADIPMLLALEMTHQVISHTLTKEEMKNAMMALKHGKRLFEALEQTKIYPKSLLSMICIGEESGTIDEMLVKMSRYYQEQLNFNIDRTMMLLEPILIIVVGIIVGGMMAAVMLPTFSAAMATM